MKRYFAFFLTISFSTIILDTEAQTRSDANKSYYKYDADTLSSFDMACYQVILSRRDTTDIMQAHVEACKQHTDVFWKNKAIRITDDSLWLADDVHGNCVWGPKKYDKARYNFDIYFYLTSHHFFGLYKYMAHLFKRTPVTHKLAQSVYDTAIDGTPYLCIKNLYQTSWYYERRAKVLIYDTIWYYIDTTHYRTCRIEQKNSHWAYTKDIITINYNTSGLAVTDPSRFDFDAPRYDEYSHYLFPKEIPESEIGYDNLNTRLNRQVKNFPLVNYYGDTIFLKDTNGWILIDMWCYGCGPCIEFFDQIQNERATCGRSAIDEAGISLFCINNATNNTPYFRKYVKEYCILENSYAAHDMRCLSVQVSPTYFLFAPNGKLVYRGYTKDYNDILNAKKRYERWHGK